MAVFDDIEMDWKGVTYTLKGDSQIMRALAAVEDHITIGELVAGQQKGSLPLAKISAAYAAMLRQAGARQITDAEVYAGMWEDGFSQEHIHEAINALLATMMPPGAIEEEEGNAPAPKSGKGKGGSSGSRTRGKRGS